MIIHECDQGTEEWFRVRMGTATASEFSTVMASGRGGGESKTRRTYMLKLAGEIITGELAESYSNAHMERGKVMEEEARNFYCFEHDADPVRVGFIANHNAGCSPDSLLGDKGMLEIKTALPHILIDRLLRDEMPPEHRAQVHGQMWVAEREWCDLVIYWPKLPLFVKRIHRDDGYIATIAGAVKQFNEELQEVIEKIRRYEAQEKAA